MSIPKQQADEALAAVFEADRRVREFQGARDASPFLLLWGALWFLANGIAGLAPRYAGTAWLVVTAGGAVATVTLAVLQARRRRASGQYTTAEGAAIGRRAAMLGIAVLAFFPATMAVLPPLSPMQTNAYISLFWALVYTASGGWLGMRMFVAGLATVAAVLAGYFLFPQYYSLWMAVVGGGVLMLAGLWLRRP